MRVLLQRVSRAEVRIAGDAPESPARVAGSIERGFLLLVGLTHADGEEQVAWMADKVAGLRLFGDAEGKMNLALGDVGGGCLVVSQFTLYGDAVKGRRPSFVEAARPEVAIPLYERFVTLLRERVPRVETGEFGAMMEVELVNDGPVTLWLER
jgi:D-tyrosyl-tRNA(Tyr) deacylase